MLTGEPAAPWAEEEQGGGVEEEQVQAGSPGTANTLGQVVRLGELPCLKPRSMWSALMAALMESLSPSVMALVMVMVMVMALVMVMVMALVTVMAVLLSLPAVSPTQPDAQGLQLVVRLYQAWTSSQLPKGSVNSAPYY